MITAARELHSKLNESDIKHMGESECVSVVRVYVDSRFCCRRRCLLRGSERRSVCASVSTSMRQLRLDANQRQRSVAGRAVGLDRRRLGRVRLGTGAYLMTVWCVC